jgi:hypothetical protein
MSLDLPHSHILTPYSISSIINIFGHDRKTKSDPPYFDSQDMALNIFLSDLSG